MGHIWTKIFRQREVRILLLGLDAAGKTTLLYKMKLGDFVNTFTTPTIGFNVDTIQYKDINITAWDIGSRDKVRPLFRHYYKGSDAVVIVIDSVDSERLDELNHDVIKPAIQSDELSNAVFLFLANKSDLPNKMPVEEIQSRLRLQYLKHTWNIMAVSALMGDGLVDALDWLACQLGSVQARKAMMANTAAETTNTEDDRSEKNVQGKNYCTRAYSAIKCFFFRSNRQDKSDEGGDSPTAV